MTMIEDEFTMIDSTTASDSSAVSLLQNQQHGSPGMHSDDKLTTDSAEVPNDSSALVHKSLEKPSSSLLHISNLPGIHSGNNKEFVLIAVMGMTGSGKTTFISKVTGRTDLQIGHGLASCTQEIQVIETKLDGRTVYFIDTPGFSDTHLSDSEILGMIADYLAIAYSQETHLSGIIYLHPISDKRVTHHTIKNLNMFRKLTGDKKLKNVVMATSMWDGDVREEYVEREKELKAKFWDVMISFGAKYSRHDGTVSSAKQIAAMLVKNKPFVLQLQKEMGEDKKTLKDTTAGQEVMNELSRMREQHKAELAAMGDMLRQSSAEQNETAIATLTEHYNRILREIEKTLEDERRMNKDSARRIADLEEKLREKSSCSVM